MRTLIVVPMKDPADAKTRLDGSLTARKRARLAQLMFRRTLRLLSPIAAKMGAELATVTQSDCIKAEAAEVGVTAIQDADEGSLNAAAHKAHDWARTAGFARMCLIPADLAVPDAGDIETVLATAADVVICPSGDNGTNALALPTDVPFAFQYGPRSCALHCAAARALDLSVQVLPLTSLSFDIDRSEDLSRALRIVPDLAHAMEARP
ncbi:MAG: 2-phospho-L-lactate guanylyltransferase [Pseudomonadota bacterium]